MAMTGVKIGRLVDYYHWTIQEFGILEAVIVCLPVTGVAKNVPILDMMQLYVYLR